MRIRVARGSYVPVYEATAGAVVQGSGDAAQRSDSGDTAEAGQEPLAAQPSEAQQSLRRDDARLPPSPAQVMRHVHFFWAAMGVVIAMLGFLVYRMAEPTNSAAVDPAGLAEAFSTSAIPVAGAAESLPPLHVSSKSKDPASQRVAAVLKTALSGFDTVDLIAREHDAMSDAASADTMRFVFSVSPGPAAGSVTLDLQNVATGKVLLSRVFAPNEVDPPVLDDRIADLVSATIPVSGTIYAYIEQTGRQSGLIACLLLNDEYYLDQQADKHEAAYRCFEKLVAMQTKSPLVYSELAALHLEAATDGYPYPPGPTSEQALAFAHRAVLMGATSPYAHRAYGFLNSRVGSAVESIRWMRKAYELNTYDLSMAAAYGYALIFSGNYVDGTPIIRRAVEVSSAHPSWWDYGLFLGQFMLGDMQAAASACEPLATIKRSHYLAARIVAADANGKGPAVTDLLQELAREFPKFAADPSAALKNGNYPPDLIEKFVGALRAAGLASAS